MFIISIITIIKEVKNVHPEDITMVKVGKFYRVYGKDVYIIAYLFKYKISEENDIMVSGFPTSSIKKIEARLENKKINYIVLDRKDNYAVNERTDFKNLNTYQKHFNLSKTYVSNVRRIENINEYLLNLANKDELKILLKDIEECIDATRKV